MPGRGIVVSIALKCKFHLKYGKEIIKDFVSIFVFFDGIEPKWCGPITIFYVLHTYFRQLLLLCCKADKKAK